jgi:hypothetical protein
MLSSSRSQRIRWDWELCEILRLAKAEKGEKEMQYVHVVEGGLVVRHLG